MYILTGGSLAMVAVAVALVLTLGGSQTSRGASPTPSGQPASSSVPTDAGGTAESAATVTGESSSGQQGGPGEDIKVHGNWTIEVREPDGTLVSHSEFENALYQSGAATLSWVLGRKKTMGIWYIQMGMADLPCHSDFIGANSGCFVIEPSSGKTDSIFFKNLTVDVPTTGADAYKLVLSGNFTAHHEYTLHEVVTGTYLCDPTAAPSSNCETSGWSFGSTFSGYSFPSGSNVHVLAGQQVLVTVKFSFN
jgi:hypothetical protein